MPDTVTLTPRIALAERVAPRPDAARGRLALAALSALALIPVAFAVWGDGAYYRAAWGSLGLLLLLTVGYVLALSRALPRDGEVRVQASGGLRFVPLRSVNGWPVIIAAVGLVPGLIVLAGLGEGLDLGVRSRNSTLLVGLSALAALWLAQSMFALRLREGLDVSPWGLMGVRGARAVRVEWVELATATAIAGRSGARLQLLTRDGRLLLVHCQFLGSDPSVVAAVIEHFRLNPDDRHDLVDVMDALGCVERSSAT